jgi:hypothetical protein
MVALWEIDGGNGGVAAEEEGILSLFSLDQPSFSHLSLSHNFLFLFFNNSVSLFLSHKEKNHILTPVCCSR